MIEKLPYNIEVADEPDRLTVRQKPTIIGACFSVGLFTILLGIWGLICWGGIIRPNASTPILFGVCVALGFLVVLVIPSSYLALVSLCSRVVEFSMLEMCCTFRHMPILRVQIGFDKIESIQLLVSHSGEIGWLCLKRKGKRAPIVIAAGAHLSEPDTTEGVLSSIGKRICNATKCGYQRQTVTKAVYFRLSWW